MKKIFEKKNLLIGLIVLALIAGVFYYFYSGRNGRFIRTGDMTIARMNHAATLLQDGRVLITGGHSADIVKLIDYGYLSSAEIYNPKTGKFTKIPDMNQKRSHHTSTLLQDGRVLITGGSIFAPSYIASAEIYDPKTNKFIKTGDMNFGRFKHSAILLKNGKVLIIGGGLSLKPPIPSKVDPSILNPLVGKYKNYGELYNPKTGRFTFTGKSKGWYTDPVLTLLPDGRVLVVGDYNGKIAELYDPVKNEFTQIDYEANSIKIPNDKMIFLGFRKGIYPRLYDVGIGKFFQAKNELISDNRYHCLIETTTLLNNNKVLIIGVAVYNKDGYLIKDFNTLYDLKKDKFTKIRKIKDSFGGHTATLLNNGDVLIVGGEGRDKKVKELGKILKEAELFKY